MRKQVPSVVRELLILPLCLYRFPPLPSPLSSVPGGSPLCISGTACPLVSGWFGQWEGLKGGGEAGGETRRQECMDALSFLSPWPQVGHGYISPPKTNTSGGIFRVLVTPWVLETPLFLCLFRLRGGNVVSSGDTFFWCPPTLSTPLSRPSSLYSFQLLQWITWPASCQNLDWYRRKVGYESIWTIYIFWGGYVIPINMYYCKIEILGRGTLFLH